MTGVTDVHQYLVSPTHRRAVARIEAPPAAVLLQLSYRFQKKTQVDFPAHKNRVPCQRKPAERTSSLRRAHHR